MKSGTIEISNSFDEMMTKVLFSLKMECDQPQEIASTIQWCNKGAIPRANFLPSVALYRRPFRTHVIILHQIEFTFLK
jgi:hypothetical protein